MPAASACLLLLVAGAARADVVVFETDGLCGFSLNGIAVTRATVIGHRGAVVALLARQAVLLVHDCNYLLSPNPERLTEFEWTVRERAKPISVADARASLAEKVVKVRVQKPSEFAAVAEAVRSGGGRGGPPRTPPSRPPEGGKPGGKEGIGAEADQCSVGSELCVSDHGELSMTLTCGDLTVGISTEGAVTIGVSQGGVEGTISLGQSR